MREFYLIPLSQKEKKKEKYVRLRSATCKVLEGTGSRNNQRILVGADRCFQCLIHI